MGTLTPLIKRCASRCKAAAPVGMLELIDGVAVAYQFGEEMYLRSAPSLDQQIQVQERCRRAVNINEVASGRQNSRR